jgi:multiple sugar transport system ATP-binding protein
MATVAIRNVRKAFGPVEVLHGVSVDIADGEFVVLVGPSGCGKSTLLRMLAGLENITSGEIAIGGRVVNNVPPKDRDIAMVFQNYALYPHMTVRQNMAFSMKLAKAPKEAMEAEVRRAAGILGLESYLDRFPRQLSGGQRQRVFLARALAQRAEVLVMDEPFAGVDARTQADLLELLRTLSDEGGSTVVVHHDLAQVRSAFDWVLLLNVRALGCGPTAEVLTEEAVRRAYGAGLPEGTPVWTG